MARTLYIHIGAHRTATSAIQQFLSGNHARLLERGYLQVNGVRRQAKLMKALAEGQRQVPEVAELIGNQAGSSGQQIHTAILTDEDICCQRDLSYLQPFRDHFDVKIIYTLRRQDLWLESWYYQNIKWQWQPHLSHMTFPEFMAIHEEFHWIRYDSYIRHLENLFGRENILLSVYEKAQMPGGAVPTFCRLLGLDDLEGLKLPGQVNSSFSPEVSEFMRQLPLDRAPEPYRIEIERVIQVIDTRLHQDKAAGSRLLLGHEERLALMAGFEPENRAVAERYFGREQLFIDPLPAADAPLAEMSLPATSQELMTQFIIPMLQNISLTTEPQALMDRLAIPFLEMAIAGRLAKKSEETNKT